MSAKKIIGCCIAGAAVCGVAVAAFKIVRDILEEKKYVSVRKRDRKDDDEWDEDIAEEF
jgi:hypothetical protein